jgi:hypothetical protein
MIMFARTKNVILNADIAGHSEMNAQPASAGKAKQHSFSACFRAKECRAGKLSPQLVHIRSPKHPIPFVQRKIDDLLAVPNVPLFAKPFDLGEFRHVAR